MALVRLATPSAGDTILHTTHFITEFDNIYNNGLSLISPLTGNLDVNNKILTNVRVENVTATPSASQSARFVWHSTTKQLIFDDGAQLRYIPALYGTTGQSVLIATSPNSFGLGPRVFTTTGSCVWPAQNAASAISTTIAVTGAALGDMVVCSHTALTMASMLLSGYVSGSGTVTVTLFNGTAAAVNVGSGTLRVAVISYA
jgi:hypothetical protein